MANPVRILPFVLTKAIQWVRRINGFDLWTEPDNGMCNTICRECSPYPLK